MICKCITCGLAFMMCIASYNSGSVARDSEFLKMALQSARERLSIMDKLLEDTDNMREKAYNEKAEIQVSGKHRYR